MASVNPRMYMQPGSRRLPAVPPVLLFIRPFFFPFSFSFSFQFVVFLFLFPFTVPKRALLLSYSLFSTPRLRSGQVYYSPIFRFATCPPNERQ